MAYCGGATPTNAAYLASKTGLDPTVALAWLKNECQSTPNATNPLNILYYGSNGQIGKQGRFGVYNSTNAGLDAAAWLVNNSSHYSGIRTAIKKKDPQAEARAIELSPWAGGNYGATTSRLGGISKTYQNLVGTAINWANYIVPGGTPNATNASMNDFSFLDDVAKLLGITRDTPLNAHQADIFAKYLSDNGQDSVNSQDWVGKTLNDYLSHRTADTGFLGIPGALQAVGTQLTDTFTWIGFIVVGVVLLIGGVILAKPSSDKE